MNIIHGLGLAGRDLFLEVLASMPDVATVWETDPFIQLIDKGAEINEKIFTLVCFQAVEEGARLKPEELAIQVARIRKLLELGVTVPKNLPAKEKDWLKILGC